jgi:hypothetical protein
MASITEIIVSNDKLSTFYSEIRLARVSGTLLLSIAFKFLLPSLNNLRSGGAFSRPYIIVSSSVAA